MGILLKSFRNRGYKGDISLSGRIGTFGQRVLGGKVDKMAEEFIRNLRRFNKWTVHGARVAP